MDRQTLLTLVYYGLGIISIGIYLLSAWRKIRKLLLIIGFSGQLLSMITGILLVNSNALMVVDAIFAVAYLLKIIKYPAGTTPTISDRQ